ncbi:histidine phosphatase family protein [Roseobacter litoralis]|uniref:histidine phosphatase family protein n=1 Tax=Roseobacter litoralis TaxID=42443 RepID=UPI00249554BC|nr:histidine phosphatase family protein [Roseobacter litoralis]
MPSKSLISRRHLLLGAFAIFTLPTYLRAAPQTLSALQSGGHVIYFRHGATTWSGVDNINWPRARQRLLSGAGIEQSRMIGDAFKRHAIPVGAVLASPFARCRDMAEIAFGRVEERMELLGLLSDEQGRAARVAYLRDRLRLPPQDGANRIIISHTSNIATVANVRLAEGEGVIIRPNGSGFTVLETLMPQDW